MTPIDPIAQLLSEVGYYQHGGGRQRRSKTEQIGSLIEAISGLDKGLTEREDKKIKAVVDAMERTERAYPGTYTAEEFAAAQRGELKEPPKTRKVKGKVQKPVFSRPETKDLSEPSLLSAPELPLNQPQLMDPRSARGFVSSSRKMADQMDFTGQPGPQDFLQLPPGLVPPDAKPVAGGRLPKSVIPQPTPNVDYRHVTPSRQVGTREVDGLVDAPIVPQSFMWTPDSDTPVPVPGVPPGSIIKSPDMTMHSLSGMGPIIKRAAAERGHGPDDVVDAKEMREINYLAKSMIQLEYRRTEKQDDRDFRKEERQDERGWREAQEKKKADRELWEKTYALYGKVANDLEKYSGKRRELARKNRKILARSGPSGDSSWRIPNEAAVPMNLAEGYGLFGVKPSGIVYEDDRGGAGPRMDDGRQLFDDDPDHEALLAEAKKEFPDARTVEVRERGKWRKSIMVTQDGEEYEWVPDKK